MHRFMAELLHPKYKVNISYFPAPQIFWDRLVQLASSQLVLPAVYGALRKKKLVEHAPTDLVSYLKEITDLNQKRNIAILKQIHFLSKLFNRNQIDYVFLKGAAILITEPYDTINERMVGDIDILVSEKDLMKAQHLLIDQGFKEVSNEFSFTKGVFSENYHKHLKRISHPNYIAAVEIHRRLLQKENHLISPKDVLENKSRSKQGSWTPSVKHQWQHAILNWQYNDYGITRNDLSFRTLTDVFYLESNDLMTNLNTAPKSIKYFYSLISLYYGNYKTYYYQKKLLYKWKLKSAAFQKFHIFFVKFTRFTSFAFSRVILFLSLQVYRHRVLSKPKLIVQRVLNVLSKH